MQGISKWLCGGLLAAGLVFGGLEASWAQYPGGAGGGGGANSAAAEAKKRMNEMQAELKALRAERTQLKETLRADFEAKEEWKDTVSNHKKAKAAYEAAKKQALASVKAKPEYKQLAKERAALVVKHDELLAKRTQDPDAIAKVGTQLAEKATALKTMERDAEKGNEKALIAKEEYDKAAKQLAALDEEVENALYSDPDFEALEQKLEQAETQIASAKEQIAAQKKADAAARAARSTSSGASSTKSGGRGKMKGGMGKGGKGGSPY